MDLSRRGVLGSLGVAGVAATQAAAQPSDEASAPWLQAVLEQYFAFGRKASGGPGDTACGAWLEDQLTRAGYRCERQPFEVPFFETRQASLACGDARADVVPQALVVATGAQGLSAPLRRAELGGDLTGAIALVSLPYQRWVALAQPQAAQPLADAFRRGAAAAVLVTNGPTGEAIAMNVSSKAPGFARPVAMLAPKAAGPFLAAASEGRLATLVVDGRGGRRTAFNLIARMDRGAAATLILSTPRSGWFACAAERGSGLAVWLSLARWLARTDQRLNLELVCTSGHEYDYVGGELYLSGKAPSPSATRLWLHIGASAAARDWHEMPFGLRPLPSADAQRVLAATTDNVAALRRAFGGVTGLEVPYVADRATAGGELTNVIRAGYRSAVGLYGIHRFFHTSGDDMRCTSGELTQPVTAAYRAAIPAMLAASRGT